MDQPAGLAALVDHPHHEFHALESVHDMERRNLVEVPLLLNSAALVCQAGLVMRYGL